MNVLERKRISVRVKKLSVVEGSILVVCPAAVPSAPLQSVPRFNRRSGETKVRLPIHLGADHSILVNQVIQPSCVISDTL